MMIHLVLAALRAVAVETQSLVGHEFPAARVDGGANSDTAGEVESVQRSTQATATAKCLTEGCAVQDSCPCPGKLDGLY